MLIDLFVMFCICAGRWFAGSRFGFGGSISVFSMRDSGGIFGKEETSMAWLRTWVRGFPCAKINLIMNTHFSLGKNRVPNTRQTHIWLGVLQGLTKFVVRIGLNERIGLIPTSETVKHQNSCQPISIPYQDLSEKST